MVHQSEISISTSETHEMHDITGRVADVVRKSGIKRGIVNIFCAGSTGAIGTIEFESGLAQDLPVLLDKLIPPGMNYAHEMTWHDGNGHSHLQATILGPSLTVPVDDGAPALGTWQQVFLIECDVKPRRRTIIVTVYGE